MIIDAIKESRKIFQRMNSYAIYRITETLRVLLFMTMAILVFNFYPVTAIMIVMIALLNDGAILSIAYDKVHYRNQPEAWNMPVVLGVSTVLGITGTVAAFGLFFLGLDVFHFDHAHVQTLMYLKLSVAGHLTIFLTRTRGPFWSIRPAKAVWIAVLGTQAVATLIAVYGVFMAPLGWRYAGIVWGYALVWFLLNDRVKAAHVPDFRCCQKRFYQCGHTRHAACTIASMKMKISSKDFRVRGMIGIVQSWIWRGTSTTTEPTSSSSSSTSPKKNSDSVFWRASMNRKKTGNSALQTLPSENSGSST